MRILVSCHAVKALQPCRDEIPAATHLNTGHSKILPTAAGAWSSNELQWLDSMTMSLWLSPMTTTSNMPYSQNQYRWWAGKVDLTVVDPLSTVGYTQNTARALSHPLQHPRAGWLTPLDPTPLWHGWLLANNLFYLSQCWSQKLHSNFKSVPLTMKYIDMSIVYWFYKPFCHLEIKVALISSTQVSDSHLSPPGALQSRGASLQWT